MGVGQSQHHFFAMRDVAQHVGNVFVVDVEREVESVHMHSRQKLVHDIVGEVDVSPFRHYGVAAGEVEGRFHA